MDSLLPFFAAFVSVAIAVYTQFLDPLRHVPGPFIAKWSRLWMVYHAQKGDMHTTMIELHKKYGKLVRTGPNEVSVADPAVIKTIYGACFRDNAYMPALTVLQAPGRNFGKAIGMAFGRAIGSLISLPNGMKKFMGHSEG